jgi:sodium/proline symporter
LLIGFTGMVYSMGLSAIWAVAGYIVVEYFLFLIYAPRLRKFTGEHDCLTIPDFFAARFPEKSAFLRILLVIIFMVFMVTYVASQFAGGGKAFQANFPVSQNTGIIITAGIVLIYTILGGFLAVSLTDVLQAFIMLIALIGLPVYGIIQLDGWTNMVDKLIHIDKNFLNPFSLQAGMMIGFAGIGLGSPGNPHILVRYMSIRDPTQFTWTAITGTIWNILLAGGALFIGLVGRAYFASAEMLPDTDPENIYLALSNKILHPALVGVILASIFAAIMSTADSQLLVAASSIVRDIYDKLIRKDQPISQQRLTLISRMTIFILVGIATILAIATEDLVFWFVLFAWAGLGAAIGPTSILTLFWKKTSRTGVITGLLTGTITVFIWKNIPLLSGMIYELIPAFFLSLLVTIIFSLIFSDRKVP